MSDIERVYKEQHTIKPFISLLFRNIIFLNMKKHWDDFFFSSSCSSLFHSQEDEKNHIFISKKRGTLKPTHTENDCDDIKVYFEERARKAVKMRKGVRERWKEKDRLGWETFLSKFRRKKKIEKRIFCVGLFIYFSSFSFFFRPLKRVMPNIHTHQVKRIRLSVFYHVVSNHLNIFSCLRKELKMIHV